MNEYTYQVPRYSHEYAYQAPLATYYEHAYQVPRYLHTYFGYRPPAPPRAAAPPSAPAATEWWRWPGELRAGHDTHTHTRGPGVGRAVWRELSRAHPAAADASCVILIER